MALLPPNPKPLAYAMERPFSPDWAVVVKFQSIDVFPAEASGL